MIGTVVCPEVIAIIRAEYEEFKPETMNGFVVILKGFGDPDRQNNFVTLLDAHTFAALAADTIYFSSTVDNFFYDSGIAKPDLFVTH